MEDHRAETIKTYQERYDAYAQSAAPVVKDDFKEWMDEFASCLPPSGSILEFGSATGRDARYFAQLGFNVTCSDVIPQALEALRQDGFTAVYHDLYDEPLPVWLGAFDGFFANAVLLHAEPAAFAKAVSDIAHVLKNGGVAAFSLKAGEGEEVSLEKMSAPRYFRYYTAEILREVLGAHPFTVKSLSYSPDGKWLRAIIVKHSRT